MLSVFRDLIITFKIPLKVKSIVNSERTVRKVCYIVYFNYSGIIAAIKLQGQKIVIAKWYSDVLLSEVFKKSKK